LVNRPLAFWWIFVLFLAQNALVYLFPQKAPALVLIGVLYFALAEGASFGAVLGVWGGLLLDLISSGRPGFFAAAFAVSGAGCGFISSKIFQDSLLTEILLPFVCLYLLMFAELWFLTVQGGDAAGPRMFAQAFLPWPLFSTLIASPFVFGRLHRSTAAQRRRIGGF
jgi:rod shape-determining protein MreD